MIYETSWWFMITRPYTGFIHCWNRHAKTGVVHEIKLNRIADGKPIEIPLKSAVLRFTTSLELITRGYIPWLFYWTSIHVFHLNPIQSHSIPLESHKTPWYPIRIPEDPIRIPSNLISCPMKSQDFPSDPVLNFLCYEQERSAAQRSSLELRKDLAAQTRECFRMRWRFGIYVSIYIQIWFFHSYDITYAYIYI